MKFSLFFICSLLPQAYVYTLNELGNRVYFDRGNTNGDTALHQSVRNGYTDLTKRLLVIGVDANLHNDFGNTPTHVAVSSNQVSGLRMLIRYGADINVENNDKDTPLMIALHVENMKLTQILLENNATIHSGECDTLLYLATKGNDVDLLKLTFGRCGRTNAVADSLLEKAVYARANNVFEYLLNNGADYALKTKDGNTLLYQTIVYNMPDAAELVLDVALSSARHSKGETDPTGLKTRELKPLLP